MVCAFVNMVGSYTGGLIFGWAYIWNALSDSNMVVLCMAGVLIFGGGGEGEGCYSRPEIKIPGTGSLLSK